MKYVQADITTVTDGYIMQQTNCTGTATKGLSKTLRDKFPNTCPYDFRIITGRQSTPGTSSFTRVVLKLFLKSQIQLQIGKCTLKKL